LVLLYYFRQLISKYPGINLIRVNSQGAGAKSCFAQNDCETAFYVWNENCYSNGKDKFVPLTRKIIQ